MMMGRLHWNDDVEEFARVNASKITLRLEADPDTAKRCKGVYKCKEKGCDKVYDSFQALGGHRASHKNFRILHNGDDGSHSQGTVSVPKLHECKLCGMGFQIGQSLGGHMRKHRLGKLDINKAMVQRRRVDSKSSSSSDVSNLSSKKALEFDLNMMPKKEE